MTVKLVDKGGVAPARRLGDIPAIQYARGIAATLVLIYHLSLQVHDMDPGHDKLLTFQSGVDIFFVISGFVMWYSTAEGTKLSAVEFMKRRLIRIVPLYWLLTAVMVAIFLVAPHLIKTSRLELHHGLFSFLFLPAENPAAPGVYMPLLAPGWTLNYELLFYLMFAIGLWLGRGRPVVVATIVAVPLLLLTACGFAYKAAGVLPSSGMLRFYITPITLEFLFGIALAAFFFRSRPQGRWTWLLIAIGLAALLIPDQGDPFFRCFRYGLPAALILGAATIGPMPRSLFFHRLGDISYSLYLSQFLVLSAFTQVWKRVMGVPKNMEIPLFYIAGVMACLVAGYACWYVLERPLTRFVGNSVNGFRSKPAISLQP